jgi:hypothetical protein
MKKISIFSLLCAAVLLGACTRDIAEERGDYDPAAPVRFITHDAATAADAEDDAKGAVTRGTPITNVSQLTTMGVFASYTGTSNWTTSATPNRMFNQKLNYSSGAWSYPAGEEEYWEPTTMTDRYSFFAYAPYAASDNGISVSSSASTAGVPTLTYTVPTDVTKQPDLMVATKKNVRPTGAGVPLDMKHALTSVGFQIAGNGEVVKAIAITGVSVTGTLAVDSETITWVPGAVSNTDFSASLSAATYATTETMSTNLIAGNGYLMMIPQTLTSAAKVVVTFSDDSIKELALGTDTWAAGKKVTYNITLTLDSGGEADILYFGANNRLSVGKWDNNTVKESNMVFTQFGSVIGFTSSVNGATVFNPTNISLNSYSSFPNFSGTSVSTSVSSSAYHKGSNITAGKGDICTLVGLTSAEAMAMSAATIES